MFTRGRIEAAIGQHQALHGFAPDDVRFDDFIDVGLGNVSVPDSLGIDHKIWAVFALIEAAGLVSSYSALKSAFRESLLEKFLQFRLPSGIAASSRISRRALVAAYEDVLFKLGHDG